MPIKKDYKKGIKYINLKSQYGRKRFYNTPEWYSIRRIVLFHQPYCVECLKEDIYTVAVDVDHIIDLVDAPERCIDFTNLQPLCKKHHGKKTYDQHLRGEYVKQHTFHPVNRKWNF